MVRDQTMSADPVNWHSLTGPPDRTRETVFSVVLNVFFSYTLKLFDWARDCHFEDFPQHDLLDGIVQHQAMLAKTNSVNIHGGAAWFLRGYFQVRLVITAANLEIIKSHRYQCPPAPKNIWPLFG
jgi:hypothetical protein